MRAGAVLLLACVSLAAGDLIKVYSEESAVPYEQLEIALPQQQQQEPETVFRVDQSLDGSLRVTGMMQNFRLDSVSSDSFAHLLSRPRASYLDLSWSNWVDQRMEVLDMFQNLMAPMPRCPRMTADSSSLDTNMVSYLASSRFGPAILTTYAQKLQDDDEDDFDYEEVFIPEGESFSKSYEDASLLEDLSADADKAFQSQDEATQRVTQQAGLGFFGANIKAPQDQAMYAAQLDGSSESLQPSIRQDPPLRFATFENFVPEQSRPSSDNSFTNSAAMDAHQLAGFSLFVLLCLGCVYVWVSLLCSCCRMGKELHAKKKVDKAAALKLAQQELLAPLLPEGAEKIGSDVAIASAHTPAGVYYASKGLEYVRIAVPLVNGQPQK